MSSMNATGIDPVALGRAGLNALALAGAAIVARYPTLSQPSSHSTTDAAGENDISTCGGLPDAAGASAAMMSPEMDEVLARALAAFTTRPPTGDTDADTREAEALAAMVQHARVNAGRGGRLPLTPGASTSGMLDDPE